MKKKVIIIVVILILCILLGVGYVKIKENSATKVGADGRTEKDQLLLNNIGGISEKYSGDYKTTEIMKKMQKLTKENIPKLYDDIYKLSDEKLEEYYNNNSSDIKDNFGKKDYEEFKEFADKVKQTEANLDKWDKLDVDVDSFKKESNKYSYIEYVVTYNSGSEVRYGIYIANRSAIKPGFIIDIIK